MDGEISILVKGRRKPERQDAPSVVVKGSHWIRSLKFSSSEELPAGFSP